MEADFSGYATKNGLKCSDGRTIQRDAFKHNDGDRVPLVWAHQHDSPDNILGHAILENRENGVYAFGFFNDTPSGQNARNLVRHGDIDKLSIYANELVQRGGDVFHGQIREVSLVLAGANPGARIENVSLKHADGGYEELEDEVVIHTGLAIKVDNKEETPVGTDNNQTPVLQHKEDGEETIQDVFDSMSEKQKSVVYFMIGELEKGDSDDDKMQQSGIDNQEGSDMPRNTFEAYGAATQTADRPTLTHDQLKTIVEDAQKMGSFKDAFLAHAVTYGIDNIDLLFPDAKAIDSAPELISRRTEWVSTVLGGVRKSPFSRVKSLSADITHDEARAKGYVKGNLKKEEFFGLAKRVTTPTTIYKKQKLDRDDIIDITDLDVVAWLKGEMRLMLDEEIGRAILIGDGREVDDEDKIREPLAGTDGAGIRSIAHDDDFYSHKVVIPTGVSGDGFVEAMLRARKEYKGKGNPTLFISEDFLTDLLLVKDRMGRRLYPTTTDLSVALRVSRIVEVEVMESTAVNGGDLLAIMVNLSDYTVGADRGGNVSMFDDFDIDYNQYKYLIEGRMSGALTKHKTALVFTRGAGTLVTPTVPTFNSSTGVVTIPTQTGVSYINDETGDPLTAGDQPALAPGESLHVQAVAGAGYYFAHNTDTDWTFTRPAA